MTDIPDEVRKAAKYAEYAYGESREKFARYIVFHQFWIGGDFFAGIAEDDRDRYVVFRGTESIGNWVLTNLQIYKTKFSFLDDRLRVDTESPIQGTSFKYPLAGGVHQGFYRAISQLWYGTEPILEQREVTSAPYLRRLIKQGMIIGLPVLVCAIFRHFRDDASAPLISYLSAITLGFFLDLVIIGFERGTWEGLAREKPKAIGDEIHKSLSDLENATNVYFVGHSLGGALAMQAFALYSAWCSTSNLPTQNGKLITFGAPRLGDREFQNNFEKKYFGRIRNIIVRGDPVPEMPPSSIKQFEFRSLFRNQGRSVSRWYELGASLFIATGLSALSIILRSYGWLWGEKAAGVWNNREEIGKERVLYSFKKHSMKDSYLQNLGEASW